jgi:molecular chaperone GrpE
VFKYQKRDLKGKKDEKGDSQKVKTQEQIAEERISKLADEKDVETEKKTETVQIPKSEHDTLVQKAKDLEELKTRFLRSAADFENAKKRLQKEREDFFKYALEGIVLDMLSVLDNFERALTHMGEIDEKTKPVYDGFLLIEKQLLAALSEHGLKRVNTVGKKFDPHLHEAVAHVPSEDHKEGTIIEDVLAGYELKGRQIRAPKVNVASKKEEKKEEDQESSKEGPDQ